MALTDAENNSISWRLDNKDSGRTLVGDKTLEENGVLNGHRLTLIRSTVAGGYVAFISLLRSNDLTP